MTPDPKVVEAIEAAVLADPANVALRVHLADLLIDASRPDDALRHLEVVLQEKPDHVEALALAAKAGAIVGDARAVSWDRLRTSLSDSSSAPPPTTSDEANDISPEEPVLAASSLEANNGTDWDGFLRDVLRDAGHNATVTLADVGGLKDVKDRLEQSFLAPLRNPELRRAYGTRLRGGLLLWGPPGCGKTFLARAVAGEIGAQFLSIGLHQILDMWLGNSEKQLHEVFEFARRNTPCVLFFDEVDAIGHSRMNLNRGAMRNVVAQLLAELDGVESSNEGIFVIGATNQPWDVDPALRRPGRFDRTMLVLPPDAEARAAILKYHLRDRPVGDLDFSVLAQASDGMSGADLQLVCEDASERALAAAIQTSLMEPISNEQVLEALRASRPSTRSWFESARNHVRYANGAGEYDELATYLKKHRPL